MTDDKKYQPEPEAHLKQWQEIVGRLRRQMAAFRDTYEPLRKCIQPIVKAQETLQKAFEPILATQERWRRITGAARLPQIVFSDLSPVAKRIIDFQKAIRASITPALLELHKTFQELPARTQEALLLLGQHGWYLDPEMSIPALWELRNTLAEGNIREAEAALVGYFEGKLIEIEKSITRKFPHRGHLIRSAIGAHRREEYNLSIPVLLAQTDGICKETVGQYLFFRQDKKPCTAIYLAEIATDAYMTALLSPLAKTLPISASEKERPEGFTALNRQRWTPTIGQNPSILKWIICRVGQA